MILALLFTLAQAAPEVLPPPPKLDVASVPAAATARPPGEGDKQHPVTARLISEQQVVAPGGVVSLGVHLEQAEHWHTYWKSPGGIGLPTRIEWELPPGAEASPQVHPVPARFLDSDLVSYGYDGEVLHISEVRLPADLAGDEVTVGATVGWLVCKTTCIPGEVKLRTTLKVGDASEPSSHAAVFEGWRQRWPSALEDAGFTARVVLSQEAVVANEPFKAAVQVSPMPGRSLKVPGDEVWPAFAPILGDEHMLDGMTRYAMPDGGFVVVLEVSTFESDPLPSADRIGGLLQVEVDGQMVRTEIEAPVRWLPSGSAAAAVVDPVWDLLAAAEQGDPPVATAPAADAEAPVGDAPVPAAQIPPDAPAAPVVAPGGLGVLGFNLFAAFVGGLILNIMPCVLPVLMLKLYGLVEQGGVGAAEKRNAGLAYTGGIVLSFWGLAVAVVLVRAVLGVDVGWGFQFQYPAYVIGLATAVFLFALNLLGVFEVPAFGVAQSQGLSSREGPMGYFFTGVFATLVATPCSAPFLGTAVAFAFQAPTWELVLVFTAVGLGLASPFLLVAFVPAAYRLLPKPGAWMDTAKQLLGFTLVATTVWLLSVLAVQVGAARVGGVLAFLTTVGLGAWVFGHFGDVVQTGRRQLQALGAGVLVIILGGYTFLDLDVDDTVCDDGELATDLSFDASVPWQPFSESRLDALAGRPVFVDFTADWCVSCKVNERTVLETSTVRDAMARLGVVPLKADWTRQDPVISAWLARYDRASVPLYLVVPASGVADAFTLPEVITPGMVVDALDRAAGAPLGQR